MPWKEPGKGDKDPWGSGDQPPDLDEVFRNMNERLKGLFGGGGRSDRPRKGGSGSSGILGILLVGLVLWAGFDSVHIIDEAEQARHIRERFSVAY